MERCSPTPRAGWLRLTASPSPARLRSSPRPTRMSNGGRSEARPRTPLAHACPLHAISAHTPPPARDISPDPLTFLAVDGLDPGETATSNPAKLLGFDGALLAHAEGGLASADGVAFTGEASVIASSDADEQWVTLRGDASNTFGASVPITLEIGDQTATWLL